jgi:protein-tyrosine phosphatase
VLPGIDDGAKDIEKSLEMLRIASSDGIKKIVATPHFYRGYYENNYEDVCKLVEEINAKSKEKGIDVEIFPGQEILLDNHTLESFKEGIIRGINGTKYMLVELPMETMPKNALDIIYELKVQGVKPIIAHPERYEYIIEKPVLINDFIDEKCLFQINSGSLEGLFGTKVKKTAETLIFYGICQFVASDAHSTNRRSPKVKEALNLVSITNSDLKEKIIENASRLLKGEDIKFVSEKIKEKKSIFSFFKRN